MSKPKVLIIGGGLCGLLIAQGLKKNNIPFEIFEKAPGTRGRNWAVTIGWARVFLDELLPPELCQQIHKAMVNSHHPPDISIQEIALLNGKTGERILQAHQDGAIEISMSKAKVLLASGIEVQTKTLGSIKKDANGAIIASFTDGSEASGDVLVSAEGGGSITRRILCGSAAEPKELAYTMMNLESTYTAEQAAFLLTRMHPLVTIGLHPKGMYMRINVLDVPDEWRPEMTTFQILATWPRQCESDSHDDAPTRLESLKGQVSDWAEPWKSAVSWLPNDFQIRKDSLKYWRPVPWDNLGGSATLAGDAAHASTFHRGQGANNAIKDAREFVKSMLSVVAGSSLRDAIEQYEKEVVRRGSKEVDISNLQTQMSHDFTNLLKSPVIQLGAGPSSDIGELDN